MLEWCDLDQIWHSCWSDLRYNLCKFWLDLVDGWAFCSCKNLPFSHGFNGWPYNRQALSWCRDKVRVTLSEFAYTNNLQRPLAELTFLRHIWLKKHLLASITVHGRCIITSKHQLKSGSPFHNPYPGITWRAPWRKKHFDVISGNTIKNWFSWERSVYNTH